MADNTTFALTVRTNGAVQAVNDIQSVGNQIQRTGETIRKTENQIRNAANSAGRAVSEQSGISARAVAIGNFIASGITKAVGAVQSFLSGSVDAYAMQEQAEAKLGAALKATGYAAGFTQKQLEDYASELQNMTTFGDEVTLQSMTMLAAFKNIRGDNFKQAQLAAMNMAEAMGKSLPEAVKLFGASLNNPIEGISKLKESGIQFSKEQIAQITELTNAGKIAEAQSIILAEAQARWGGAAAAAAQTATGQMKQVTNAAGDIKEGLGGILMNVFSLAGGGSTLSQTFSEWAGYLKEHMNEIAFSIVSVGLKIMEIAERIIVLFEPVWTTIIARIKNIVAIGQWLYDNWSKIWANIGSIAIAYGKDLYNYYVKILPNAIISVFKEIGSAIWDIIMNPSEAGARLSQMLDGMMNAVSKAVTENGKNIAEALKKAGVSAMPEMQVGDFSAWTDFSRRQAEIAKKYEERQKNLKKNYAAAEDARKAKSITPAEIRNGSVQTAAQSVQAEERKFASIAERGSSEAWKTILANQRTGGAVEIAQKQLDAQNRICESVDKVSQTIRETAKESPAAKTGSGAADAVNAGIIARATRSGSSATPEKQLKVTEEIRDVLKEISKSETMGAFAL